MSIQLLGCIFIASTVDFVNGGYTQKEQAKATTKKLNVKREVNQDYAPATERPGNTSKGIDCTSVRADWPNFLVTNPLI